MTPAAWVAIGVAALIALVSPVVIRPLLERTKNYDVPNERSSHTRPTLRAGGIAQLAGWIVGGTLLCVFSGSSRGVFLVTALAGGVLIAFVGLVEDLRGVPTLIRLGLQLTIGALITGVLCYLMSAAWGWVLLGAFAFAAYVNMANFMDGINGISGLHGLVVGVTYAVIGYLAGLPWLACVGALLAVTFLVFLPWNLTRPGLFLGDVGSYLLGGGIAAMAIGAAASGVDWLVVLSPLAIYLADTSFTILRRISRGDPILQAHCTHIFQRLTQAGLSHPTVSLIVAAFSAATAACGILAFQGLLLPQVAVVLIVLLCVVYLSLPRWRGHASSFLRTRHFEDMAEPDNWPPRPNFRPKRWIVIGGSGFIGQAIVNDLLTQKVDVQPLPAPRLRLDLAIADGASVSDLARRDPLLTTLIDQVRGSDIVVNAAGMATPDGLSSPELFGANALLPALLAEASRQAGVSRFIHLSSAAVQGRTPVLDTTPNVATFSPYSESKALGERALLSISSQPMESSNQCDIVIVRATSVQGEGRQTSGLLAKVANSPLSSVAAPGTQPTVVSSLTGLTHFIRTISQSTDSLSPIVLQPWEGQSVTDALVSLSGKRPKVLPRWICQSLVSVGYAVSRLVPRLRGMVRRIELMWFGQRQFSSRTTKKTRRNLAG